jgi:peptidoglycan L-alanyl-D-glutamate endopeptidase CwlK
METEKKHWTLSKASLLTLATVKPELQKVILYAAAMSPVPFAVVSGNRTRREQAYIYAQGRTRPGLKITWTMNSNHMGGRAIDFSAVDAKGKVSNMDPKTWNAAHYKPIAEQIKAAGKKLGIPVEWGIDMWKKDFGHIQMKRAT